MNYFDLLGLSKKYDIDLPELKRQYFLMQAKYHPDKVKNPSEKRRALEISMQLNEAYKTLGDDYFRAEYMLKLKGEQFDEQSLSNILSAEELEELLSEFEILEEASSRLSLEKMENNKQNKKDRMVIEIAEKFAGDKLKEALDLTVRLKYLINLLGNIRAKLKHANNRD